MSALVAIGVLVAGFIAGVILYQTDHWVIGIVVMLAAVPIALVAWVKMNERI
jgi:hypothetical protein